LDNARTHLSQPSVDYIERHKFIRVLYSLYSPDAAPNDFYLFGCLKGRAAKCRGTTKEELFRTIIEILASISEEESVQVFLNWMARMEQAVNNKWRVSLNTMV
jgi:hypothetical protein